MEPRTVNIRPKILLFVFYSLFFPIQSFAQPEDFTSFVQIMLDVLSYAIPSVIGLTFVVFLWGVAIFILNAGNEQKRAEGRRLMIWGVIALFVMFSFWAIVAVLAGTFGINFGIPQLRTS